MRRRSRSSDELLGSDWSEEVVFENSVLDGSRARSIVGRRKSLLESFRDNCSNINLSPTKTKRSSSIVRFPARAFSIQNSAAFHNPDLFSEVYSMAFVSASIFALAEVRQAAKNGAIDSKGLSIVSTPVVVGTIVEAFIRNEEYFSRELKAGDYEFLSSLSKIIHQEDWEESSDEAWNFWARGGTEAQGRREQALLLLDALSIEYFGDDHLESECMYMITRNPNTRRIGLIFRGSTTVQDWIKDSKLVVSEIENPVADRHGQLSRIGIHRGFREYLYGDWRSVPRDSSISSLPKDADDATNDDLSSPISKQKAKETSPMRDSLSTSALLEFLGLDLKEKQKNMWNSIKRSKAQLLTPWEGNGERDDELADKDKTTLRSSTVSTMLNLRKSDTAKQSRLGRILSEIKSLLRQHTDYKIYVTGHSLGGALGLLAALEIAERFGTSNLPVTFVGIGNPRAGTEGFRDAVKVLEREGKLRCMSVHGQFDIVGMLPTSTFMRTSKRRFCQSGFELLLDSESNKFHVRRSERPDENYMQRIGLAIFRADKIAERHHYMTYLRELEALERPLQKLHLNDFYDKFVDQNLFPCSKQKMTPMSVRASRERNRESVVILERPSKKAMKRILSADDLLSEEFDL